MCPYKVLFELMRIFFIDAVYAKSDKEPNSFHVHHKNNKEVYLENLHGINSIISMPY